MTAPGQRGGFAVGIDLGTSNTVVVVRWPDGRTRPLLFDGQPILPSGVCLDSGGTLHVGRDAERMAQIDPARYEPNPKRRIDDGGVLLGDRDVSVAELLTAPLRLIARTVTEAVGFLPQAVMTYPAAWGQARRQILQEAAARAGWPPVRLVPEPIAAARYFTETLRRPVPPASTLAIFDFGGGTLDVALVRNDASGLTVIGAGGADNLGGLDVDAALVEHLGVLLQRDHPDIWRQITRPADELARRHRRLFWDDVRAAKEMLSRTTVAPVAVPGVSASLHVTRDELEALATPLVERAVNELTRTMRHSGVTSENLSGVFLVGGASRIPLVARLLHTELGLAPTVLEQPELPVAEGALADLAVAERHGTRPGRPTDGTASTPPGGQAPVSAAPMSGVPMSGVPMSGVPMSGVPMSPAPAMTAPRAWAPTAGAPVSPPRAPVPPRRKRSGRKVLTVLAVIALAFGGTGYAGWYFLFRPTPTFQPLADAKDIPIKGFVGDKYATSFMTGTRAIAVAQVGRQLEVAWLDIVTGTVMTKRIGDAAGWQEARLFQETVVVAVSEAEPSGRRKLVALNTDTQETSGIEIGKDDVVRASNLPGRLNQARDIFWLDRATNRIKRLGPDLKPVSGSPSEFPSGSELLNRRGETTFPLYLRAPDGMLYDYPGPGKKVLPVVGPFDNKLPRPELYVTNQEDGLLVATEEVGYSISSAKIYRGYNGPSDRAAVWLGNCSIYVCVIDEKPGDPASRELALFNNTDQTSDISGAPLRVPVPYADPTTAPPLESTELTGYIVVPTNHDEKPGAVVIDTRATGFTSLWRDQQVGHYNGYLMPTGASAGVLFPGPLSNKPAPTVLVGIDFEGNLRTALGSPTIRSATCSASPTHLICAGDNGFTVWRTAR